MPAREPEEWLKLYFQRMGTLPLPSSPLANIIAECASDVRNEALLECYELCLGYFQDNGVAQNIAKDIKMLLDDNMRKTQVSTWANDAK